MPKKILKDKSPIKLRRRKAANGNYSLYLDIYIDGKRKREFLKLYLLPERSEAAREANEKTIKLAEAIKTQRLYNLQLKKEEGFLSQSKELNMPFADFVAREIKKMESLRSKNYVRRYACIETWVRKYDDTTLLRDISKQWVQGYIRYLTITPNKYGRYLSQNTIHEYLIYIANILNNAVREGIIPSNPTKSLQVADRPKKYDSKRDYLTLEEVQKLIEVPSPSKYNDIRRAFLFACFCGLRYSDIEQLEWKDIRVAQEGLVIEKKLQKTQNMLVLPLNKKAESFLPERDKNNERVFKLPKGMATVEAYIKVWSEFARIDKHVTFHTSRHTFAVNILAKGGDVYTLSKLLGHKRITTTQIYAEVLDENKKKTIELLDN